MKWRWSSGKSSLGTRDKIKFAGEVREHALDALKINPNHSGAKHVMGVWNAEIMRLSGFQRMIAKNFLGGKVFGEANWDNAQKYLEESVALEPSRITHHLDLGAVYADRHETARATEQYQLIAQLPIADYNDKKYKEQAAARLKDLR